MTRPKAACVKCQRVMSVKGKGMCPGCYGHSHGPCRSCERKVFIYGRGLCKPCHTTARKTGSITAHSLKRKKEDVLEDILWLLKMGEGHYEVQRRNKVSNRTYIEYVQELVRRGLYHETVFIDCY